MELLSRKENRIRMRPLRMYFSHTIPNGCSSPSLSYSMAGSNTTTIVTWEDGAASTASAISVGDIVHISRMQKHTTFRSNVTVLCFMGTVKPTSIARIRQHLHRATVRGWSLICCIWTQAATSRTASLGSRIGAELCSWYNLALCD